MMSFQPVLLWSDALIWLLVFASIPGKVLLTGFLFYLVPIHLAGLGNSQAVVGRVLMCYGVAALLVTPLAGRLARTPRAAIVAVGLATVLQGLSVLLLAWRADTAAMVGATVSTRLNAAVLDTGLPARSRTSSDGSTVSVPLTVKPGVIVTVKRVEAASTVILLTVP